MVAVDAMGGDYAPQEVVLGALAAAQQGIPLTLFGNQDKVIPLLVQSNPRWRSLPIEVVHCDDVINMEEEPVRGILRKKDASLIRALQAVASGKAKAFVSAGNSGAVVAAASILIGRVPGVLRPAIASFLPSLNGSFLCLDLGANPDSKPEHLVQFAYMGHAYARVVKHIAQPKIALLSNGHENYKGTAVSRNAFDLLQQTDLNFMGNIESRDIFSGTVDVVVTDGFTGNVLLKGIQGTAKAVFGWIAQEAHQSVLSKIALGLCRPIFSRLRNKLDYSRTGGALLLGVNDPVVVAHGSSKEEAVMQAIFFAHANVEQNTIPVFNSALRALLEKHEVHMHVATKPLPQRLSATVKAEL